MTRRTLVTGLATAAAVAQERQRPIEWKPRLGILGPFSESNVRFAKEEEHAGGSISVTLAFGFSVGDVGPISQN